MPLPLGDRTAKAPPKAGLEPASPLDRTTKAPPKAGLEPTSPLDRTIEAPPKAGLEPEPPVEVGHSEPRSEPALPARIGRFNIECLLGEGSFGKVYRGLDAGLERPVAIKVPHSGSLTPEFQERFLSEARLTAKIRHKNICTIYEVGTDGKLPFMVMHFVPGETLADLLDRLKGPLSVPHSLAIAGQLALGMAEAHRHDVLHLDLKPQNVLYDKETREVVIADFGVAILLKEGKVLGTPAYMSPEQWGGRNEEIGKPSDVYSLGVILYRMLTGVVPFTGTQHEVMIQHASEPPKRPSSLNPNLDRAVDAACLQALAKDPKDRFPSAKAFAEKLAELRRASEIVPIPRSRRTTPASKTEFVEVDLPFAEAIEPPKPAEAAPIVEVQNEIVRCPRCDARLMIVANRMKAVDCLKCHNQFSVASGREAAAQFQSFTELPPLTAQRPPRITRPLPPPLPEVHELEDNDDRPSRWSGRRLAIRAGLLLFVGFGAFLMRDEIAGLAQRVERHLTGTKAKPSELEPKP